MFSKLFGKTKQDQQANTLSTLEKLNEVNN